MKRLILTMVAAAALAGCRMTEKKTATCARGESNVCAANAKAVQFPARKKVIGLGWDTGTRTPGELADRADQIAALGLDG